MALRFGKKKDEEAAAAPSQTASNAPEAGSGEFDLAAFAENLETADPSKAVAFDDPTPQGAGFGAGDYADDQTMIIGGSAPDAGPAPASAFDWAEESLLGDLNIPTQGNAAGTPAAPSSAPASFDPIDFDGPSVGAGEATPFDSDFGLQDNFGLPAAPVAAPLELPERKTRDTKITAPESVGAAAPMSAPTAPKAQKSKLVPILGLVALLIIGGGGYVYMTSKTPPDDEIGTDTPTIVSHKPKPAPSATKLPQNPAPITPPVAVKPAAPPKPAVKAPVVTSPVVTPPVVAMPVVKAPIGPPKPAAAGVETPAIKAQLKTLWEQGKAAKQKGDIPGARKAWEQALKIAPGHPGFQDSIDKLGSGIAPPAASKP